MPHILNSWKEIARYLGRGVRTVQRWERDLGLPVRRPHGRDRSTVLALAEELDHWLAACAKRPRLVETAEETAASCSKLGQATVKSVHQLVESLQLFRQRFTVTNTLLTAALAVSTPARTEAEERRCEPRYPAALRLEVRVPHEGGSRTLVGRATDLSRSGIAVTLPMEVSFTQPVAMRMKLPACTRATVLRGVVANHRDLVHGMRFIRVSPAHQALLDRACRSLAVRSEEPRDPHGEGWPGEVVPPGPAPPKPARSTLGARPTDWRQKKSL